MADTTTILIHDPEVVRDIERLAERTGKPATEAVAEAVRARLGGEHTERTPEEIEKRRLKVEETLAQFRAMPHEGAPLTDKDLYDEDGFPR